MEVGRDGGEGGMEGRSDGGREGGERGMGGRDGWTDRGREEGGLEGPNEERR